MGSIKKKCERLNCIVGPHICAACQKHGAIECDIPVLREVIRDERTKPKPGRVRERSKALRMVERELKTTWLYETTGYPLLSIGQQCSCLSSPECVHLAKREREEQSQIISALDDCPLDSNVLESSPI